MLYQSKIRLKPLAVSLLVFVSGAVFRVEAAALQRMSEADGTEAKAPRSIIDTLPRITEIWLEGGNFIALDTRQCDSLTAVNCPDEKLFTLNVDECPSLTTINCSGNRLKTLNLSDNLALQRLICSGNALTELNVSQNHELIRVRCSDNPIKSLDVSGLTKLSELEADISTMLSFKAVGCVKLENLFIGKAIKELDLSKCVLLEAAPLFAVTEVVRLDSCLNLKILEKIEDKLNLQQLSARQTALIKVDVSNSQIQTIDLTHCNAMVQFKCTNTRLRDLDLSTCKNLHTLYADSTHLETINVSGLPSLENLHCHNNPFLTKLNITGCSSLKELRAGHNRLQSVRGVSDKLQVFEVAGNGLPFSQLYPFMQSRKEGAVYSLSPQVDTVNLKVDEIFDLNKEMTIGGQATEWTLLSLSDTVVPNTHYRVTDGLFRIYKSGTYKLVLTNAAVQDYTNGTDAEDVSFTWYIKVTGKDIDPNDTPNENILEENVPFAYADHRVICLSEPMSSVQVYNAVGQCVYSGAAMRIPIDKNGLYIVRSRVRSRHYTFKVAVK